MNRRSAFCRIGGALATLGSGARPARPARLRSARAVTTRHRTIAPSRHRASAGRRRCGAQRTPSGRPARGAERAAPAARLPGASSTCRRAVCWPKWLPFGVSLPMRGIPAAAYTSASVCVTPRPTPPRVVARAAGRTSGHAPDRVPPVSRNQTEGSEPRGTGCRCTSSAPVRSERSSQFVLAAPCEKMTVCAISAE